MTTPCPPTFKLSYESVILDSEDVKILETSEWFNDKLLTFIGEYLMNSVEEGIHIFSPSETEMIRHSQNDQMVDEIFGMLGVDKVKIVAWIMNNNNDVTNVNGGSHWSLLIFDREFNDYSHFDSCHGANDREAEKLKKKTEKLVNGKGSEFRRMNCIQQENSSDCGLFVAQFLATLVEKKDVEKVLDLTEIEKTREYWRELILKTEER